jgi:hypothetical protein
MQVNVKRSKKKIGKAYRKKQKIKRLRKMHRKRLKNNSKN